MGLLKRIEKDNAAISNTLFILCITLLGTFLRVQYLQKSDFVINDGGMFYTMILDLQKNNYILPVFTSYNQSQIPYAYPPLSFYSGAVLNQFLHIDLITVFRLYPLFFNVLSIPAVYFLAKEITRNNRQAILATAFYSILLSSFEWLISGGGLTRSPAHTLFIVALTLYLVFLRTRRRRWLILSIITAALMTLHHIEYCWMLVLSIILFSCAKLGLKECLKIGLIYLSGVLLLTSPYWGLVLANHGISPFVSAFTAGEFSLMNSVGRLAVMVFTQESLVNYINVLAIIGLIYCLFVRNFRIILWLLLIIFLNPRSADRLLIFPVTILASICLHQFLCPALEKLYVEHGSHGATPPNTKRKYRLTYPNFSHVFIAFSILYPFFLGFINTFSSHPNLSSINSSDRDAMEWIEKNTADNGEFVLLDSYVGWSVDAINEWFPALTLRNSVTTIQGTEWLPNSTYLIKRKSYEALKRCINSEESCLNSWVSNNNFSYSYLYVAKTDCTLISNNCPNYFLSTIKASEHFTNIFENEGAVVFKRK